MRARPVLAVAMASSVTALVKPLSTRAAVLAQVPKLVDLAAACGWDFYEVAVEQVSMSFGGHALPGKRDLYLALMHPTLG